MRLAGVLRAYVVGVLAAAALGTAVYDLVDPPEIVRVAVQLVLGGALMLYVRNLYERSNQ